MLFWIFMFLMSLLIPLSMILIGRLFSRSAPKQINCVFGYRTAMSMKNLDTWEFAHRYCGKTWSAVGRTLLVITIVIMLLLIGKSTAVISWAGALLSVVQVIIMLGTIIPVEKALKQNFDQYGRRKR